LNPYRDERIREGRGSWRVMGGGIEEICEDSE